MCVQLTFGMIVNGRCGGEGCGAYYSSFGFHLLRAFFLMFFMEFGINPSYVFRCFYEMILNRILAEGVCVVRFCQSCVDRQIS